MNKHEQHHRKHISIDSLSEVGKREKEFNYDCGALEARWYFFGCELGSAAGSLLIESLDDLNHCCRKIGCLTIFCVYHSPSYQSCYAYVTRRNRGFCFLF